MARDLLPPNTRPLERALARAGAAAVEALDAEVVTDAGLAAHCPPAVLAYLAWERSVDVYGSDWTLETKRNVVAGALPYHKVKGTPGALKRALAQLSFTVVVTEWFQEAAAPYTFRLSAELADNVPLPQSLWREIVSVALEAKNARSHLAALTVASAGRFVAPRVVAWLVMDPPEVTLYPAAVA